MAVPLRSFCAQVGPGRPVAKKGDLPPIGGPFPLACALPVALLARQAPAGSEIRCLTKYLPAALLAKKKRGRKRACEHPIEKQTHMGSPIR